MLKIYQRGLSIQPPNLLYQQNASRTNNQVVDSEMAPFVYDTRMDMCIIDLDQTAMLLRQALNFTAHMAYKCRIILFVCRQTSLVHLMDKAAMDCGEFSYTRNWKTEVFTATDITLKQKGQHV